MIWNYMMLTLLKDYNTLSLLVKNMNLSDKVIDGNGEILKMYEHLAILGQESLSLNGSSEYLVHETDNLLQKILKNVLVVVLHVIIIKLIH